MPSKYPQTSRRALCGSPCGETLVARHVWMWPPSSNGLLRFVLLLWERLAAHHEVHRPPRYGAAGAPGHLELRRRRECFRHMLHVVDGQHVRRGPVHVLGRRRREHVAARLRRRVRDLRRPVRERARGVPRGVRGVGRVRLRGPRRDGGLGMRGFHVRLFDAAADARAVAATDVRAISATDACALASAER